MATVEKHDDGARGAVPQTELSSVVLHAGETSDVTYLKDYIQVIFCCGILEFVFIYSCDRKFPFLGLTLILHCIKCDSVGNSMTHNRFFKRAEDSVSRGPQIYI